MHYVNTACPYHFLKPISRQLVVKQKFTLDKDGAVSCSLLPVTGTTRSEEGKRQNRDQNIPEQKRNGPFGPFLLGFNVDDLPESHQRAPCGAPGSIDSHRKSWIREELSLIHI